MCDTFYQSTPLSFTVPFVYKFIGYGWLDAFLSNGLCNGLIQIPCSYLVFLSSWQVAMYAEIMAAVISYEQSKKRMVNVEPSLYGGVWCLKHSKDNYHVWREVVFEVWICFLQSSGQPNRDNKNDSKAVNGHSYLCDVYQTMDTT